MNRPTSPSWPLSPIVIVAAPLLAIIASFGDIALLLFRGSADIGPHLRTALLATIPLSVGAGLWTLILMLRLRREVLRRAHAEGSLRTALTQRERSLERELAIRRELDHRVRNNLAGLIGLVGLYERSGRSASQLAHSLRAKIEAMRGVHDIASRAEGGPIDLASLLARVADSLVPSPKRPAIIFGGPAVSLQNTQAGAMAMILQELTTNSLKHGALATDGHIDIVWSMSRDTLHLAWTERGLPLSPTPRDPNITHGVGLPLIQGFARSDLRGGVNIEHDASIWRVDLDATLAPSSTDPTPAMPTPHRTSVVQEILA